MTRDKMIPAEVFAHWKQSGSGDEELIAYMDGLLARAELAEAELDKLAEANSDLTDCMCAYMAEAISAGEERDAAIARAEAAKAEVARMQEELRRVNEQGQSSSAL